MGKVFEDSVYFRRFPSSNPEMPSYHSGLPYISCLFPRSFQSQMTSVIEIPDLHE